MDVLQLSPRQLRAATVFLAIGTIGFGGVPIVAPRQFAALFGLPAPLGSAGDVPIQSVGARDVVSGIGLLSAAIHRGRVTPWLLGRLLSDATDAVWVLAALVRGARSARLASLGLIAVGAAVVDFTLYRQYQRRGGLS